MGIEGRAESGNIGTGLLKERDCDSGLVVEESHEDMGAGEFLVVQLDCELLGVAQGLLHFDG